PRVPAPTVSAPAASVSGGETRRSVRDANDAEFAAMVLAEQRVHVVVHFWAEWNGPCRMVAPVLEEIAKEYSSQIKVMRLNIDENPAIAQRYSIMAIPTLTVFDRGQAVLQIVGAKPKSALVRELSQWLERPDDDEEKQHLEDGLALTLSQGRIRLVKVRSDGTYSFVDSADEMHGLIYLRRMAGDSYVAKVEEFEHLINDSYTAKADLVAFLEENPTFLLGGDYKSARSRIFLTREYSTPLKPDFFLQPVTGELCDILEVQPPQHEIAVSVGGTSMISEVVLEAVSKLNAYRDYFEDDRRRMEVEDKHGVVVFRPRLFVIIGRSGKTDPLTRRKLEGHMGNISLRTWDEILDVAKRRAEL
ncbi:MAG: thioredoxin, partial [Pseudonocardiaceae bacterium]